MNIDFNIAAIVVLSGFTIFFAISFLRSVMRERKAEIYNRIDGLETDYWREHEKIWQRVNNLERCCREQESCKGKEYPVKNHYNTGA